jgi:hypothetical protein
MNTERKKTWPEWKEWETEGGKKGRSDGRKGGGENEGRRRGGRIRE